MCGATRSRELFLLAGWTYFAATNLLQADWKPFNLCRSTLFQTITGILFNIPADWTAPARAIVRKTGNVPDWPVVLTDWNPLRWYGDWCELLCMIAIEQFLQFLFSACIINLFIRNWARQERTNAITSYREHSFSIRGISWAGFCPEVSYRTRTPVALPASTPSAPEPSWGKLISEKLIPALLWTDLAWSGLVGQWILGEFEFQLFVSRKFLLWESLGTLYV